MPGGFGYVNFAGRTLTGMLIAMLVATCQPYALGRPAPDGAGKGSPPKLRAFAGESYVIAMGETGPVCETIAEDNDGDFASNRIRTVAQAVVPARGNITFIVRFGDGFASDPEALDAFLRAAAAWCSLVEATQPITIVLDADFGPTVFGRTGILGQAHIQPLIGRSEYEQWRSALVDGATTGRDLALYASLPNDAVPTDIGPTDTFVMPSAVLRVAGLLPPITDPDAEMDLYGAPPSIEMLSTAPWDFDPDDGIRSGTIDFVGVALHEIGHVIGFTTRCGSTEINPSLPVTVSAFDVFRFRPGVNSATFTTAPRILTAGGEQMHFSDSVEVPLSTSRLDLTGGDGFGADHWKDDSLTGVRLGVMDPQPNLGQSLPITSNDLQALRAMGYHLVGVERDSSPFAVPRTLDLSGATLTIRGDIYDIDGDVASVALSLLDPEGRVVLAETREAGSGERAAPYELSVAGLDALPIAVSARLVFTDAAGNVSAAVERSFSQADEGGPRIDAVTFNGRRVIVRGRNFNGASIDIEINTATSTAERRITRKKVKITGSATDLGLNPGPNRIRIVRDGKRSNSAILIL